MLWKRRQAMVNTCWAASSASLSGRPIRRKRRQTKSKCSRTSPSSSVAFSPGSVWATVSASSDTDRHPRTPASRSQKWHCQTDSARGAGVRNLKYLAVRLLEHEFVSDERETEFGLALEYDPARDGDAKPRHERYRGPEH